MLLSLRVLVEGDPKNSPSERLRVTFSNVRAAREKCSEMSNRLYVGNLPFHATEDLITQRFAACGEVREVALMLDRMTGRMQRNAG